MFVSLALEIHNSKLQITNCGVSFGNKLNDGEAHAIHL